APTAATRRRAAISTRRSAPPRAASAARIASAAASPRGSSATQPPASAALLEIRRVSAASVETVAVEADERVEHQLAEHDRARSFRIGQGDLLRVDALVDLAHERLDVAGSVEQRQDHAVEAVGVVRLVARCGDRAAVLALEAGEPAYIGSRRD